MSAVGRAYEVNFDGLVGPTHSYAGLAYGNVAATKHRLSISNPKEAALQGLAKMKFLRDLDLKQAVLPPQERPDVAALRRVGFTGTDAQVLWKAREEDPVLLASCCSASGMWTANAATVSPSCDTSDARVHFTAANLVTQFHRSIEAATTAAVLRRIFTEQRAFVHHTPLPATGYFADEGAANHTRLCATHGGPGVEMFVYGRSAGRTGDTGPAKFPARQTLEASQSLARLHGLDAAAVVFARQAPQAIDAGAFHNDVVAVGNQNVLLCHAAAWADQASVTAELRSKFAQRCGGDLVVIEVSENELPLAEAVETYLFNCQLVTMGNGEMAMIAPIECQSHERARAVIERIVADHDNPIRGVHYLDVRQSMRNGGGPACLRLRVVLDERQLGAAHQGVFLDDRLYGELTAWVERHYRDRLHPDDLADPKLLEESRAALDALTGILGIGSVYPFQQAGGGR